MFPGKISIKNQKCITVLEHLLMKVTAFIMYGVNRNMDDKTKQKTTNNNK